jgi:hypothetical protein
MKRIFLFSLVFCSCSIDQKILHGTWQAAAYFEMGKTVDTPLDAVRISFSPSGDYQFKSIGYYEEKGQYRVAGKYLFLLDTTTLAAKERAVKILHIAADSLKIGMEADGKKSTVFFARVQG